MRTIDRTFYSLCEEIDDLKEAVAYWKTKYAEERDANIKQMNESFEIAKQGVANALSFALCVKDDENGNLVIDKDDRQLLAKNWK